MRRPLFVVASSALVALAAPVAAEAQSPAKDIVETAAAVGTFTTFARALAEAGLTETLKGPGPFTVLAPSDEAFAKIPKATLDALFKDKRALRNVLLYHVIAGRLTAADFANLNGKGRKTVEGSDARVAMSGTELTIGTAVVLKSDMVASNGIVHTIDRVLMPPGR
jgi:uncharacterized surface protein with fasciclin (FAS1) repeats